MEEDTLVAIVANVVGVVIELIDSDEDNDTVLEKIDNYYEVTVQNFNDTQFKQHFRITRETFEFLLQELSIDEEEPIMGRPKMPLEKQLLICIWYLGNMESFRSVACRFGIGKHCCWYTVNEICSKMIEFNVARKVINFPTENEANAVTTKFEEINGFPGIVGAIDGCHIEIEKPKQHGNSYFNRKGYPSVLLQGICDSNKVFLDVYAGEPGCTHDQRMFTKSDIYRRIRNNEVTFPGDSHLIGDLAYKLSNNLIVGFKNDGHLTIDQIQFNKLLNQNRVVIENAFGLLKARWRRLKKLESRKMDVIPKIIVTACIFHNICMKRGDMWNIVPDPAENGIDVNVDLDEEGVDNQEATMKRENIMNLVLMRNIN